MNDLAAVIEFITTRLDDEDAAARAVPAWADPQSSDPFIRHVCHHFPDRELRRSLFDRAVLAGGDEHLLRLLAAVWSDHEDYDPSWA